MATNNSGAYTTANSNDGFYHKCIRLFSKYLNIIKSKILLYIICILAGIVPLVMYNYSVSDMYKASFTVAYDELFRKIYGDRLAKLNTLIQRKQYAEAAVVMKIPVNTVKSLNSIEGKNILGEDLSKDLNTDHLPFVVNIIVDDSSKTKAIQDGIVNFLATGNEFMSERKKIKELENEEELEFVEQQLRISDSLLKKGYRSGEGSSAGNTNKKEGSGFEYNYELYKRKQELLRKKRMPVYITVIDDAIVSTQAKKSFTVIGAAGFIIGNILFAMMALFVLPVLRYKD